MSDYIKYQNPYEAFLLNKEIINEEELKDFVSYIKSEPLNDFKRNMLGKRKKVEEFLQKYNSGRGYSLITDFVTQLDPEKEPILVEKLKFIIENDLITKNDQQACISAPFWLIDHKKFNFLFDNNNFKKMVIQQCDNKAGSLLGYQYGNNAKGVLFFSNYFNELGLLTDEDIFKYTPVVFKLNFCIKKGIPLPLKDKFVSGFTYNNFELMTKSNLLTLIYGSEHKKAYYLFAAVPREIRVKDFYVANKALIDNIIKKEPYYKSVELKLGETRIETNTFTGVFITSPLLGKQYLDVFSQEEQELIIKDTQKILMDENIARHECVSELKLFLETFNLKEGFKEKIANKRKVL